MDLALKTAPPAEAPLADPVRHLTSAALEWRDARVRHGFFGRWDGVSEGIYAGLNAGPGSRDDAAAVRTNRGRIARVLGLPAGNLLSAWQVHSPRALVVDAPSEGERPQCDALVTRTPGLGLCILTADCAPLLFADFHAGVIGAAHAGWRGAHTGVIEATLEAMEGLGASADRVHVAVGPCISKRVYEVGPEFEAAITGPEGWAERLFTPGVGDRRMFDLKGYVKGRLARAGVRIADISPACTFSDADAFFSHRRSLRDAEPDYGRNASVIALSA
jgi:YfiH family protein